jgi:Rab-GTPase-TBC domain
MQTKTSLFTPRVSRQSSKNRFDPQSPSDFLAAASSFIKLPLPVLSKLFCEFLQIDDLMQLRSTGFALASFINSDLLLKCLRQPYSLSQRFRAKFWLCYCADVKRILQEESRKNQTDFPDCLSLFQYYKSKELSAELEKEISQDVRRTAAYHEFFGSTTGNECLFFTLHALVACEPEVAYCQGASQFPARLRFFTTSRFDP